MPIPPEDETVFHLVPERSAVRLDGREVVLTATQFRLLAALMEEPGRAISRAELVGRAFAHPVDERTVDVHIKDLRRRLGRHESQVKTVRGKGYCYLESPASGGQGTGAPM